MTLIGVAAAAGIFLLLTGGFVLATGLVARHRRKIFLRGLGGVVRIGTPCRVVDRRGRALIPGTVALTPAGLMWEGLWGRSGSYAFEEIQRLETDDRLSSGRGFLRSKVLRVTATSGEVKEFVLSPGHAWEWRQALGEWAANRGRIAGTASSSLPS
ncbi:MAG TPA: hypothetical protein VF425_04115 [Thermoanaerobaculia bacterium]